MGPSRIDANLRLSVREKNKSVCSGATTKTFSVTGSRQEDTRILLTLAENAPRMEPY